MALNQIGTGQPDGSVVAGLRFNVTASGGATRVLTAQDSGGTFLFDSAAGVVYTLPAPVAGIFFDFVVSVAITSNSAKIITSAATVFVQGGIESLTVGSAVTFASVGNGTTHIAVAQNGTTTGGLRGTLLRAMCLSATLWDISGTVVGSGTLATPYSTT